ncbi:ustYa family protein [Pleurotus pulmonarius]
MRQGSRRAQTADTNTPLLRQMLGLAQSISLSPLAIAIISAAAVNLLAVFVQFYVIFHQGKSYTYAGGDRPRELLDDVPLVNMAFHDDPHYFGLNGHNSSLEWNSLLPAGDGIVFMGDNGTPYDVSMWHQLRCLNSIRMTLIGEANDYKHAEHCFHYLRQAILCSADLTLEPLPPNSTDIPFDQEARTPGPAVAHTCKNWRQIYHSTEELSSRPSSSDKQAPLSGGTASVGS